MGRLRQKGKAGAAKNYVTRSSAVKKLQCSLADFRRLCILKGIFPREPRSRKRANKGSSAPTSFYYAKDIAFLAHEPVLKKLREHKAFAKRLSRALGRGEWSNAKSLDENKPVYRLDHIIKERYPTFIDALRDIDDSLCMISLFATLPTNARLPREIVENCSRLSAEWQLYIMHSHSLRKIFLSIKGVYYQAEIMDQTVTWLIPYQFTQIIPSDVDVRVMLTFLELYQTLLGFVLFKLYTDIGLTYPPSLDVGKDETGAGVGAFSLQDAKRSSESPVKIRVVEIDGRTIFGKDIRHTIKSIVSSEDNGDYVEMTRPEPESLEDEDFVSQPSRSKQDLASDLPTLRSISALPPSLSTSLFGPYTFFLSREVSRPIFEFIIRSFGGRVGWPASAGSGSPFGETEQSITHVVIDRLAVKNAGSTSEQELRLRRKHVQPQWIVDSINAGRILLEEQYAQGNALPPHLSPFGEYEGAYNPIQRPDEDLAVQESESELEILDKAEDEHESEDGALEADLVSAIEDPESLRTAELAAEAAGLDYQDFEAKVKKFGQKSLNSVSIRHDKDAEKDMNKIMMSNKQKKLFEKMKFSQKKKETQKTTLETRKRAMQKNKKT